MKKKVIATLRLSLLGLLTLVPPVQLVLSVQATEMLDNLSVPQGKTLQLIIPRFDFKEAVGLYEDKSFSFYPITETIAPDKKISRAEFIQLIQQNQLPEISCPQKTLPAADFPDLTAGSSFHNAVQWAASCGIISGYEDGLFHPYAPVTRGQAAKIIMRAYRPPRILDTAPAFLDLPLDYSLRNEVYDAVSAAIFRGYPDGLMRPDRAMNFQEAETIVGRASGLQELTKITARPAFRAFLGIHRSSEIGSKNLTVELKNPDGTSHLEQITLTVTGQNFAIRRFNLSEEKNALFGKDYQDNTWELINAAKAETFPEQLWEGKFIIPAGGETTLGFGDKLYINGAYSGSHFGIDYANQEGTPVYASNTGVVTLAGGTPAYGNTIIIDHGQDIFTMYLHLQDLKVQKGQTVDKNDLIATMGSTGIATGPHLHFTHFIGDIIVDSQDWYEGY